MNFCVPLFHRKYFTLLKNKYLEVQLDKFKDGWSYFELSLKWTRKTHHAGISFTFEIMSYFLGIDIYDNRHWNYEEEKWQDCDTEEENA